MDKQALLSNAGYQQPDGPMIPDPSTAASSEDPQDEEFPSAPPADMLDDVVGYEGTIAGGGEGRFVPPPASIAEEARNDVPHPQRAWSIPSITEETAREAFIQFASSKCCYSSSPAKEMDFRDLRPYNTYRYRLESFTESRSTEWTTVPYKGQFVDGSAYGVPPLPWNIIVKMPPVFQDHTMNIPVPHTSSMKGCHACMAMGRRACTKCTATGKVKCWVCHGRGFRFTDDRCNHCNGIGLQCCDSCAGCGTKPCGMCKQSGQLLVYIQLTIKWKNYISEQVADQQSGLPVDCYSKVTGQNVCTDEQVRVYPIIGFPDSQVDQASQRAIQEHQVQLASTSRIIQQFL
ncbi:protein SSUH2 homolog isoform X2 [Heptranchias perlo]|uniref:protein SSUH2 homolog isoform X2 n=1 Tax=Heptranchias perlo TaxID=212740 RepID=UPI00355A4E34